MGIEQLSNDELLRMSGTSAQEFAPPPMAKLGAAGRDDAIMSVLKEQGWLGRNYGSMGLQLQKAWEGLTGGSPNSDVSRTADLAAQEAPVGAIVGDLAKYAPAALGVATAAPILAPAAAAAGIAALTTPGSMAARAEAGATEGAFGLAGGALVKGAGAALGRLANYGPMEQARKVLRNIIGEPNVPEATRRANAAAGTGATSEEALASMGNDAPAALTQLTRAVSPGTEQFYAQRYAAQQADELARLQQLAMGADAVEARLAREALSKQEIAPLNTRLQGEYAAADTASNVLPGLERSLAQKEASRIDALRQQGQMATEAAQQESMANGQVMTRGSGASTGGPASTTNAPGARVLEMDPPVPSNVRTGRGETPPSGELPSGAYPVPGYPRVPARLTNNADRVPELQSAADDFGAVARQRKLEADFERLKIRSLEQEGYRPLTVNSMVESIQRELAKQTTLGDPVKTKVLNGFLKAMNKVAPDGDISAEALHTIRKEHINSVISKLVKKGESRSAATKAGLIAKNMIDDAIEGAGGSGWKTLMRDYATHFEKQGRLELLDNARELFRKSPEKFIELIQNESPEVVQKIFKTKFDMRDVMPPRAMADLNDIAGGAARRGVLAEGAQSKTALDGVVQAMQAVAPPSSIPNFLNRVVTATNTALKGGAAELAANTTRHLDQAMRDPAMLADLLTMLPPTERSKMLRALASKGGQTTGAVAGAALGEQ